MGYNYQIVGKLPELKCVEAKEVECANVIYSVYGLKRKAIHILGEWRVDLFWVYYQTSFSQN